MCPIYTFECPRCGCQVDKLRKIIDTSFVYCDCQTEGDISAVQMEQVPAVPAPMQWGCPRF